VYSDGVLKYTSSVVNDTTEPSWNQVAEFYVEDVPSKNFTIKIHDAKDNEKVDTATDPVLGVWTCEGNEVAEMLGCSNKYLTLNSPKLRAASVTGSMSTGRMSVMSESMEEHGKLRVSLGYFPVYAQSKSHDVGVLQLDIIGAENLEAVDGSSDPYCVISLNGTTVFKTKQVKKTLNPVFNVSCQIPIQSRSRAKLGFEIRGM
jgi:Ca2+-dependent lipid-binding protein